MKKQAVICIAIANIYTDLRPEYYDIRVTCLGVRLGFK